MNVAMLSTRRTMLMAGFTDTVSDKECWALTHKLCRVERALATKPARNADEIKMKLDVLLDNGDADMTFEPMLKSLTEDIRRLGR
jgi:hypothetical protein